MIHCSPSHVSYLHNVTSQKRWIAHSLTKTGADQSKIWCTVASHYHPGVFLVGRQKSSRKTFAVFWEKKRSDLLRENMSARLFVLVALASLFTVSYGIDCIQCVALSATDNCQTLSTTVNATTCSVGTYCSAVSIVTSGSWTSFVRSCAPAEVGAGCISALTITTCSSFCQTDGCNSGDPTTGGGGGGAGTVRASALFLLAPAILAAVMH
ncbi:Hypp8957 [Branchiostoma lanceolatum]|uniref:Hypp8957 protein n=1 Tax=Branchiostoma lanceolatum TaxID=7740 RepID=A0A8K0EHA5_BRALA|nr:Hypp8957 [Branchiostoma lanceolatum]